MTETRRPDFQYQVNAQGWDADKRREWFKQRAREAGTRGARWHRFEFNPDDGSAAYASWKRPPENAGPHISGPAGAI